MAEKKTKEISKTDRKSTHEKTESETELTITLSPTDMQKLQLLATIAHNEDPSVYVQKVLLRHIQDRLYLVKK